MRLTNIGKNQTMITHTKHCESLNINFDYDVYFSYSQPIMVVDWEKQTVYENDHKYSVTTSKHMNQYKRMCNRFDADDKGKYTIPHGRWQHKLVNESTIDRLNQHCGPSCSSQSRIDR